MPSRLVLVHGFTQTARSWDDVRALLGNGLESIALDAPGHGSAPLTATLWAAAEQLVASGGAGTYVGYSMGARLVLHAALAFPESVERLVLLGATPGIRDGRERASRRAGDDELAESILRDGVPAFVDRWLAGPLFAGLPPQASQREERLRNTPDGLTGSLRTCGTGTQDDLWPRLNELRMPVLVMAGALDTKFATIAEEMAGRIGANATLGLIPAAGHAAHLEQPHDFVRRLLDWLHAND